MSSRPDGAIHTGAVTAPGRDDELHEALGESQRLGFLGARPVPEVVEHARMYVRALGEVSGTVMDLGAGGGIPGLVIAHDRPDLRVLLIDRRQKRTDFLERICRRFGWLGSVEVLCTDVDRLVAEMADGPATERPDAVVARGFGPPERTLTLAAGLVRPGGLIVISEPPDGDRWDPDVLSRLGVRRLSGDSDRIVRFVTSGR